jgi:acetyl-CoA carboxylase biotin carboxyl carrier protein
MSLSNQDIADILSLLDGSRFSEMHLKTDNFTLSLSRSGDGGWVQETAVTNAAHVVNPAEAPKVEIAAAAKAGAEGLVEVESPLLGTFYRAPKPGAPAYVDIGSEVDTETVVGLIETMKLMNSVYAGVKGRVREILVSDAQFVEQGTVLLRIEPQS